MISILSLSNSTEKIVNCCIKLVHRTTLIHCVVGTPCSLNKFLNNSGDIHGGNNGDVGVKLATQGMVKSGTLVDSTTGLVGASGIIGPGSGNGINSSGGSTVSMWWQHTLYHIT